MKTLDIKVRMWERRSEFDVYTTGGVVTVKTLDDVKRKACQAIDKQFGGK